MRKKNQTWREMLDNSPPSVVAYDWLTNKLTAIMKCLGKVTSFQIITDLSWHLSIRNILSFTYWARRARIYCLYLECLLTWKDKSKEKPLVKLKNSEFSDLIRQKLFKELSTQKITSIIFSFTTQSHQRSGHQSPDSSKLQQQMLTTTVKNNFSPK